MARSVVGTDYHNQIMDKGSVSVSTYLNIVDSYNKICLDSGFQYLWSNLILDDGSIIFTSGTSSSKDATKGDHALFFDTHSDPAAFQPVIHAGKATFYLSKRMG